MTLSTPPATVSMATVSGIVDPSTCASITTKHT
jgi:hypothetical protein